jgi:hypothetical protein
MAAGRPRRMRLWAASSHVVDAQSFFKLKFHSVNP